MSAIYEAIWSFEEDFRALKNDLGLEFEAHITQPLGTPLHRYEGTISINDEGLSIIGEGKDAHEKFHFSMPVKAILDFYLGWDDVLKRWKDTRALIKPLRIKFENKEGKTLYIYAKRVGARIYGRENKLICEKLSARVKRDQE